MRKPSTSTCCAWEGGGGNRGELGEGEENVVKVRKWRKAVPYVPSKNCRASGPEKVDLSRSRRPRVSTTQSRKREKGKSATWKRRVSWEYGQI